MYGYKNYTPLNIEEILQRTTEEDVFGIVIQEDIIKDKGAYYKAPYRQDNNGDCYFEYYSGMLWFIDFGKGYKPFGLNCFQFIEKCFNCSFNKSLDIINEKLNLGLGFSTKKPKKIKYSFNKELKEEYKPPKKKFIKYISRDFNSKDQKYWSQYNISKQDLIEDGVVPVTLYQSISRKGVIFSIKPIDICYAYTKFYDIEGNLLEGKVKIYRPQSLKKEEKWLTNCNQNDIGGLETLPEKGNLLVVTKSLKDARVLRNLGLNVIWFQNEGMIPSKDILKSVCKRFKRIVVFFDNDNAGITNSKVVVDYINSFIKKKVSRIFLPPKLLQDNIKDSSDLIQNDMYDYLISFLRKHKIL